MTVNSSAGLSTYTGPWTVKEAQHLLRRTLFGAKYSQVQATAAMTMSAAVDALFVPGTVPLPPVNNYDAADPNVALGQTWVNAIYDGNYNGPRRNSFVSWLVGNMLNQSNTIEEKITLFWHNHFAVESDAVSDARMLYRNYMLMRNNGLGDFKNLVKLVTKDVAMLIYLNGRLNTNTAPDENYARELQELFTIGKDNPNAYTEDDVKAAAKVLTGFRIDATGLTSTFLATKHDTTNKQFSSFYNNTIITGQTGANGQNELDDLLTMIFQKNEVSEFICRKLYRFFVYYEIDASIEANIIQPLALVFRNSNYNITAVLKTLLKSQHFFDATAQAAVIKPPIDYTISLLKEFDVVFPPVASTQVLYFHWSYYFNVAKTLLQEEYNPPNVSGWPAYYQKPVYHENWINANTISTRLLFVEKMNTTGYTRSAFTTLIDVLSYTASLPNANDPDLLMAECAKRLLAMPLDTSEIGTLKAILLSNQTTNSYWTTAWNNYISNPTNASYKAIVKPRLQSFYATLLNSLQYQLS